MKPIQRSFIGYCLLSAAAVSVALSAKKATGDTSNPAYKDAPVSTTPNPSGKPAPPAGFVHPGILVNRAQMDEIKKRVGAGTEPQKTAFEALKNNKLGALDYTPRPRDTVECGSFSRPDLGCKDEQADSEAAYAQALLWYITGNKTYAENAVKIMNAWSGTLTGGHECKRAGAGLVDRRCLAARRRDHPLQLQRLE
ncbi:MAG: alginate lyase family protein [Bryobacteraceae bacterium]